MQKNLSTTVDHQSLSANAYVQNAATGDLLTVTKRLKLRIHISGVTKCVTKFLTLSKSPHCDSVKKFVTHFVTPEIWTLI